MIDPVERIERVERVLEDRLHIPSALSFIGLGAVLIGIGLFYQRILVKKGSEPVADS